MILRLCNAITMNFERPSNFPSQAKIDDLSTRNSILQTKMEAMEKTNFALRENVSNMEAKLQESLMKNVLLEEKVHKINSKHDDLEQ